MPGGPGQLRPDRVGPPDAGRLWGALQRLALEQRQLTVVAGRRGPAAAGALRAPLLGADHERAGVGLADPALGVGGGREPGAASAGGGAGRARARRARATPGAR